MIRRQIKGGAMAVMSTSKETPQSVWVRLFMKAPVQRDILIEAVRKTMQRYPYFCVRIVREADGLYYEENAEPVMVMESNRPVALLGEASNYHSIAFNFSDCEIGVSFHHAMTDGAGIFPLLRTLSYYYCCKAYNTDLSGAGVRLAGEPFLEGELVIPLEADLSTDTEVQAPAGNAPMKNTQAFNLFREVEKKANREVFRFQVDENRFVEYTRSIGASPATYTAISIAHILEECYPEHSKPIVIGLAANMRGGFDAPRAYDNCITMLRYNYSETDRASDDAAHYRAWVKEQTCGSALKRQALMQQMMYRKNSEASMEERLVKAKMIRAAAEDAVTFAVSYTGKLDLGDAEEYVADMSIVTAGASAISVEMDAVAGHFTFDLNLAVADERIPKMFAKIMEPFGLVALKKEDALVPSCDQNDIWG